MAELKTKKNRASVAKFLNGIENERRRKDCKTVVRLMKEITGEKPVMWGESIIGFGSYHYRYDSGREGDWFLAGVSPRKQSLTLYVMGGLDRSKALLARLGKHKTGKSCLYINKLDDIDLAVLEQLIARSVARVRKTGKGC